MKQATVNHPHPGRGEQNGLYTQGASGLPGGERLGGRSAAG